MSADDTPHTAAAGRNQVGLRFYVLLVIAIAGGIAYLTLTVFVIQPIGALPNGRTLIILRVHDLNFIDSADGFCERSAGGVSLLCRGTILGKVVGEAPILLRLPYSETLYRISTGGSTYGR